MLNLEKNGYFKNNIAGSAKYRELLSAAVATFQMASTHGGGMEGMPSAAARIDSVLEVSMHMLHIYCLHGSTCYFLKQCQLSQHPFTHI